MKIAIIGGGPGGYVTAIRLQQYGFDTILFEKERLGGVCLNWGCIPTKSLVKVADLFHEIKVSKQFGISVENPLVNYKDVFTRKNKIVEQLVSGVEHLFKKRNIPVINETVTRISKFDDKFTIFTANEKYDVSHVIIATGSKPKQLPTIKSDGNVVLSSRDILKMEKLPKRLLVVGGGVIGCEFASIYSQLGVKVEIVEFLPRLVYQEDEEISKRLAVAFKKMKVKLHLKTAMESYEKQEHGVVVKLSNGKTIETDSILLSVGRTPTCDIEFKNFSLEKENDFIKIDENCQTNEPNLFAIGDVTGKLMLAHTASKQGLLVADLLDNKMNGKKHKIHFLQYQNIPRCTFTNPEVASIGLTEEQAKSSFSEISIGKFMFSANGKALGLGNNFGFVKTIVDSRSEKIIGMHILGAQATELIAQCSAMIGMEMTIEDIKKIVFAHPTLSEAVMESIEDIENLAIHKL